MSALVPVPTASPALMPGASYEHNLITSNVTGALIRAVGDQAQVLPSDMRLYIPTTSLFTYADVIVLEGPPDLTLADAHR